VALELLGSWNRDRCVPPLADDEVLQIINSIGRRELARREAET
jgi:Primase C terminal 1 (PriCT-1).